MVIVKFKIEKLLLLFVVAANISSFGQKKPLDYSSIENWPEINHEKISTDGKCVLYTIQSKKEGITLIVRATDNGWEKKIPNASNAIITEDSRRVIFFQPTDSLCILDLGTKKINYISHVRSYRTPAEGNGQWLAYQLTTNELNLWNLYTGEIKTYLTATDFYFSSSGKVFLFQTYLKRDGDMTYILQRMNLPAGSLDTVHLGSRASHFCFDKKEEQLVFTAEKNYQEEKETFLYYYKDGMKSAAEWVNTRTPGLEQGFILNKQGDLKFSPDGHKLFLNLQRKRVTEKGKGTQDAIANVDIWNYKDGFMQPFQLTLEQYKNRSFMAVINVGEKKVILLKQEQDDPDIGLAEGGNGDWVVVRTMINEKESFLKHRAKSDYYLVSTKDGVRKCLLENSSISPHFSANGKYLIWCDYVKKAYFTYELKSRIIKNITEKIPVLLSDELNDRPTIPSPYGLVGWFNQDEAVLIYDRYDIWQVDPKGIKPPVNVTNGFGRKNRIILRYVDIKSQSPLNPNIINMNEPALLAGFNETNKYNGFFQKKLNDKDNPTPLIMSPEVVYMPSFSLSSSVTFSTFLLKAKNADVYIVKRMSASKYPNLYITKDFGRFSPLSDLNPQKEYNWMNGQLLHWKTFKGKSAQGILYKPEDFDSKKKYPVILFFYERMADGINNFLHPKLSNGIIDIPYFISNGYLVFCPDICYKIGQPGESTYDFVVSGAKHISKMPFVNAKKMGIDGHSFGGYEVNYLVTNTSIFAAAVSGAGISDFVSIYLSPASNDMQLFIEKWQLRIGGSLWKYPKLFIQNSPIFKADKVSTPLLIMHNKKDTRVPWEQGFEWFAGLRRMEKKVWMLQYDGETHTINQEKNQLDFSIRLSQFFDHYLKGTAMPKWMTEGVPARLKGIETGLELDMNKGKE